MKKISYNAFFLIVLFSFNLQAQSELSNNSTISLMTTSPWNGAVYSLFGHTILRVEDDSTGVDAVFNYGYFDSSQSNFMYNFVKGETDYILGAVSYEDYMFENKIKGLEVIKQELNLSQTQKQRIWEYLYTNSLPENRQYRYNFLYDNCATRPRDIIESAFDNQVFYKQAEKEQTFRELIHQCVQEFPWVKLGIDIVIGSSADKPISIREKMFLPSYLMHSFATAEIYNDNLEAKPLVSSNETILKGEDAINNINKLNILNPIFVSSLILIIVLIVSYLHFNNKKLTLVHISDAVLFLTIGVGGIIVAFLVFVSEHPATSPNWNIIWMNPFSLIAVFSLFTKLLNNIAYWYHFCNFVVLFSFLLFWWIIPQQLPLVTIPIIVGILIRSLMIYYLEHAKSKKEKSLSSSK